MDSIKILFKDDELLVIDKPFGVVVNRSHTHNDSTVQDYIEEQNLLRTPDKEDIASEAVEEFKSRSGIVHRLDKDTSGVLIVARTAKSFINLQEQFKDRSVKKEYRVIVVGKVTENKFEVDAPLGRNPKNRLSMAIIKEGRPALTKFELIKNFKLEDMDFSMLKAFPFTGRTHQIRVHLAALGTPVVGDRIYCSKKKLSATDNAFNRMMLHSLGIEFTHPDSKKTIKIESELPRDFTDVI